MILSEFFITEYRRNPEMNPNRDIITALAPYQYDPTAYITFTGDAGKTSHVARGRAASLAGKDVQNTPALTMAAKNAPESQVRNGSGIKIGVNPRPMSNETPVGVYAYPLSEVWDDLVADTLPYASQKPYVVLLRSTGHLLGLATYTEADLSKDISKLMPVITNLLNGTDFQPRAVIEYWTKRSNASTPGSKLWSVTKGIAEFQAGNRHGAHTKIEKSIPIIWNAILRALNYGGVDDRAGEGIIHDSEKTQTVFLDPKAYKIIGAFDNRHPMYIGSNER